MLITKVRIRNFRSILSLELDLDQTSVFIGPNNSGKTAILDAVRLTLGRRWGQQGSGFTEYDLHRPSDSVDPHDLPPIVIELVFVEPTPTAWPDDMKAVLDDLIVLSQDSRNMVTLRLTYGWDSERDDFIPTWVFLNAAGDPYSLGGRRSTNLSGFFGYLPLFWLSAIRDAEDQFSSKSHHWGGLIRSIRIPEELESEIRETLTRLDGQLLAADPRLGSIADTIGEATRIAIGATPGAAKLNMLPLNTQELLLRAGVILRNEDAHPWLPLENHGHGLQSLAVIFLFQAAAAELLSGDTRPGIEPVFGIEEPESHLHPQAARVLLQRITDLPGQKLVTTHSPYFAQNIPLHNLRIVHVENGTTVIASIQRSVVSQLPWTERVAILASHSANMLERDPSTGCVSSRTWFQKSVADKLAQCWDDDEAAATKAQEVYEFHMACRTLMNKDDETKHTVLARRTRGEIFFARRWVIVEGPSEYILLHAIGEGLEWPLDQHGVAVIDFGGGADTIYPALADAFHIPWDMLVDGDRNGMGCRNKLSKRGFSDDELASRFDTLPDGRDLEEQLLADGHEQLLREIMFEVSGLDTMLTCPIGEFKPRLHEEAISYMTLLATKVSSDHALALRMPALYVEYIQRLMGTEV